MTSYPEHNASYSGLTAPSLSQAAEPSAPAGLGTGRPRHLMGWLLHVVLHCTKAGASLLSIRPLTGGWSQRLAIFLCITHFQCQRAALFGGGN